MLNLNPAAIVVLDETGGIVRANERAGTILHLSQSAPTSRTFDDPEWEIVDEAWRSQATADTTKVVPEELLTRADELALQRMLENLIRNSFEHGDDPSGRASGRVLRRGRRAGHPRRRAREGVRTGVHDEA
ncbi:MAG: PAS domain-containing protein [Halolamina sp.]